MSVLRPSGRVGFRRPVSLKYAFLQSLRSNGRRLAGGERERGRQVLGGRLPHLDLDRLGDSGLGQGVDHLLQLRTCASGAQFCFDDDPNSPVSVQELK